MSDVAIRVEAISKQYRIGKNRSRYRTLRDTITNSVAPLRRVTKLIAREAKTPAELDDQIIALKDVSFQVEAGEVVGVIGRNGAGKSTILKILSRITEPTSGAAQIHGRVGSLLEVGTGFHPELSGRENVYLNGAILGMKATEIKNKFDEIVAFAEVERFIDTPVKHYSSGMYMRLAFAVAAHLEPDIMLVDEVLAVGDAAFQQRCLGKMGDVARAGRTVLFVSHNMAAVLSLCPRSILFDGGRLIADGASQDVVDRYMQSTGTASKRTLAERRDRKGNQALRFLSVELREPGGNAISRAYSGQDIIVALKYTSDNCVPLHNVHVAIGVHGKFDERLFHLSTTVKGFEFSRIPAAGVILCKIPCLPLQPGRYSFNLFSKVGSEVADWLQNAGIIEVEAGPYFDSGRLPPRDQGPFIVQHSWSMASEKTELTGSFHGISAD